MKTIVYDYRITDKSHVNNISTAKLKDDNKINPQVSRLKVFDKCPTSVKQKPISDKKIRKHDFENYCNNKLKESEFKLGSQVFKASVTFNAQPQEVEEIEHSSCPPDIMIRNCKNNVSNRSTPTNLIHSDDTKDKMEKHKKIKKTTSLRRNALLKEKSI